MKPPHDSDIENSDLALAHHKKWRLVFVLFAQLALVTAIFGVFTPDSMGYLCLALSLVCVTLAANAFLAE